MDNISPENTVAFEIHEMALKCFKMANLISLESSFLGKQLDFWMLVSHKTLSLELPNNLLAPLKDIYEEESRVKSSQWKAKTTAMDIVAIFSKHCKRIGGRRPKRNQASLDEYSKKIREQEAAMKEQYLEKYSLLFMELSFKTIESV